jgi:hypothetical protein
MRIVTKIASGLIWGLCACRPHPEAAPAQPHVQAVRALPTLPTYAFEAPKPWQSRHPGIPPVEPPDMTKEIWRVLVTQDQPLQRKTPLWQQLPAAETVELQMPEGSSYRCIVPPLDVTNEANMFETKLKLWRLSRSFLCSNDDFHSWNETILRVNIAADGSREYSQGAGLLLRERVSGDDTPHKMFVLMRPDKERREATVGPPQIIAQGPQDLD